MPRAHNRSPSPAPPFEQRMHFSSTDSAPLGVRRATSPAQFTFGIRSPCVTFKYNVYCYFVISGTHAPTGHSLSTGRRYNGTCNRGELGGWYQDGASFNSKSSDVATSHAPRLNLLLRQWLHLRRMRNVDAQLLQHVLRVGIDLHKKRVECNEKNIAMCTSS